MPTADDLKGKVAIVTGASRGLGRAFAVALAEAGAAVAVTGRTEADVNETADLARQKGAETMALVSNVADPEDVRRTVETVE